MSNVLKKSLLAAGLVLAAASLCGAPAAFAAEKKAVKAAAKAAKIKVKAKAVHEEDSIPEGPDADITDTVTTDYNCELGAKLTIFANEKDDSHIALRWKKRIHRLDKIGTTTGALRFENATFGLIWIGIPSKGMLLDAKLNRQLANECKNAEQERGVAAAPAPVEKPTEQPSTKVKVKVEPIVPPLPSLPAAKDEVVPPAAVPAPAEVAPPAAAPAPAELAPPAAAPAPAELAPPAAAPAPAELVPPAAPAAPTTPI